MEVRMTSNMWPDLIAIAALLPLAVYQLMIFWGRKKDQQETYNLYFAWFVLSVSLLIISPYFQKQNILYSLRPGWLYVINIEMFAIWMTMITGIGFLNRLLGLSPKYKQNFQFTYLSITVCLLLTLTSNFLGTEFYFKHVQIYLLYIVAVNVLLINYLYGRWVFQKRLYKERFIRFFYFGHMFLISNLLVYRILEIYHVPQILIFNHYLTAAILFIFAYALSAKSNKEHEELSKLKFYLDARIKERADHLIANYKMETESKAKSIIVIPSGVKVISVNDQFLQKAFKIIERNLNDSDFNAEKFSEEIGISRAHLHRKLKTLTNQSTSEFIRTIRLKKAAELLNQKAASVSEIAYDTGFNNLSYFTRCFKVEFGVVPSEYSSMSPKASVDKNNSLNELEPLYYS